MKKIIMVVLVSLLVLGFAAYVFAAAGSTKIKAGGPHDIPAHITITTAGTTDQPCAYCHIPHRSKGANNTPSFTSVPLSNRVASTYSGFCMTCHDGTVGAGDLGRQPSAGNLDAGNVPSAATLNMADHVIGGTGHVVDVSPTWNTGTLDTKANALTALGLSGTDLDTVTCRSCHAVHNHADDTKPFLRISNANSALCTACHNL